MQTVTNLPPSVVQDVPMWAKFAKTPPHPTPPHPKSAEGEGHTLAEISAELDDMPFDDLVDAVLFATCMTLSNRQLGEVVLFACKKSEENESPALKDEESEGEGDTLAEISAALNGMPFRDLIDAFLFATCMTLSKRQLVEVVLFALKKSEENYKSEVIKCQQ